jgi:hypothetical protein
MAQAKWQNADGLQVPFANYYKDAGNFVNRGRAVVTAGAIRQCVVDVDLSRLPAGVSYTADLNNDGTNDGFSTGDFYFPAQSSILRAFIVMTEAAAGGTSMAVGIHALTGAAIDADGIMTATEGVTANLALGDRVYGAGAYVAATAGTDSIGAADGYLSITTVGTFTAGKGKLVIEYLDPTVDA